RVPEDSAAAWRNAPPATMDKSCEDYAAFLSDKRRRAKESAMESLSSIKSKLNDVINEYNKTQNAERLLKVNK
ncbi:MAG: hypothetical protein LBH41_01790, partial [Rickettsiales bacterium]|nr:hypothetical protein [Rickettsiales bacterium]